MLDLGERGDEGLSCDTGRKPIWWLLEVERGWRQKVKSGIPPPPPSFFVFFFFFLFFFF
jgi:hypothetical protein